MYKIDGTEVTEQMRASVDKHLPTERFGESPRGYFCRGYAAATTESAQTIAAQQQQIAVLREALKTIVHDAFCLPKEKISSLPYHRIADEALAQPFDTSALERYRNEVLEELALHYNRGDTIITHEVLQAELRRMAKGE